MSRLFHDSYSSTLWITNWQFVLKMYKYISCWLGSIKHFTFQEWYFNSIQFIHPIVFCNGWQAHRTKAGLTCQCWESFLCFVWPLVMTEYHASLTGHLLRLTPSLSQSQTWHEAALGRACLVRSELPGDGEITRRKPFHIISSEP